MPAVAAGLAALALIAAFGAGPARADDAERAYRTSPFVRDITRIMGGVHETAALNVRFRPGSRAEAEAARAAAAIEESLHRVRRRLGVPAPGRLEVFLYDRAHEMAGYIGRRGVTEPVLIDEALHVPLDALDPTAAIVHALEPVWGRAGGELGGALEGGRWYELRIVTDGDTLEAWLDGRRLARHPVEGRPGAIGFGIEEGRLAVRELRVRADDGSGWAFPLRDAGALRPDVAGLWRVDGRALEGAQPGRLTRARFDGPARKALELEAELRISAGATAEVLLHADAAQATRLVIAPRGISLAHGALERPTVRFLTGPRPILRQALADALSAADAGEPLHERTRALLERGRLTPLEHLRLGAPRDGAQRTQRRVELASFVAYLLEEHGADRYRGLHFSDFTGADTPLGRLDALERAWHGWLKERPVRAAALAAAERHLGLDVFGGAFTDVRLAPPGEGDLLFGRLGSWSGGEPGLAWRGPLAHEEGGAQWGYMRPDVRTGERVAMRAQLVLDVQSRAALTFLSEDRQRTAVELAPTGLRLVDPDGDAVARHDGPLPVGAPIDLALVLDGGGARVYLDGALAADVPAGLPSGPGFFAVQVSGAAVAVRALAHRDLE